MALNLKPKQAVIVDLSVIDPKYYDEIVATVDKNISARNKNVMIVAGSRLVIIYNEYQRYTDERTIAKLIEDLIEDLVETRYSFTAEDVVIEQDIAYPAEVKKKAEQYSNSFQTELIKVYEHPFNQDPTIIGIYLGGRLFK